MEACLGEEGLIKYTIVPPEGLYYPVFSLCRTCALTPNTGECNHKTNEERALTGTWVIDEVRLAVQKRYRIFEIHEVYEHRVTIYDPVTRDGGLFAGYIDTFFK